MKYVINYKPDNSVPRIVNGDRMKVDHDVVFILKHEGNEKFRVVAVFNREAIKEIIEEEP